VTDDAATDPGRPTAGRPSRRAVLAALLGGGAVVATGTAYVAISGGDDGPDTDAAPAEVPPDDALAALGRRYLRDHPDEADAAVLLAALPALGGAVPDDPTTQLAVLRDQVAADYESGAVVEVDGWILALTEARAAALYALDR